MTTIREIPEHLLASIFARLSRWNYPNLASICREFRSAIRSEELYEERHRIGNTESVLYSFIRFHPTLPAGYILNRTNESFRLSRIWILDDRPHGAAVVTIGFYIYVFGGKVGAGDSTSGAFRIDCRTHQIQMLASMRRNRSGAAAGVVDGEIYVIGGCLMGATNDWVEVFNVQTLTWRPLPGPYPTLFATADTVKCVVMENKIYVLLSYCYFKYEPRNNKWEILWGDTVLRRLWRSCSCVVRDVLFSCVPGLPILAFDPTENFWRPVQIFNQFPLPPLIFSEAKMANVVVILAGNRSHTELDNDDLKEIWCIQFTVERRQDGAFRGNLVRVECVLTPLGTPPHIEHCLAVTI